VENARNKVASLLNCPALDVIFTSGGTESNNYAIMGAAIANENYGKHIITTCIEHPSVVEVCKYLERKHRFKITFLPVEETGLISLEELENSITKETILITIMYANNEIGTIQPIKEISEIARKHNILFHTDASQALGKITVDINELKIDLLSIAGHKLYAPKGIGALYVRKGVLLEKLIHGADQERHWRTLRISWE